MNHRSLVVRLGTEADVHLVLDLLEEAAAWIRAVHRLEQWPERFPEERVLEDVDSGALFVCEIDGVLLGALSLAWSDPMFWGDRSDAGFVHRLVVRRDRAGQGLGARLLRWVDGEILRRGRGWLCIDVLQDNVALRAFYEGIGFRWAGAVSGQHSHPSGATSRPWHAALYERACRRPEAC